MKPFTAPNRPFCVEPFAPLTHQPRSVIDAGLVYWGSHESEPQKGTEPSDTTTGLRFLLASGYSRSWSTKLWSLANHRHQRAAVLEDEVDDTYYIHTYRQTNKQTHTYRQTHRQTNRQTHSERQTDRQTHIQKGRRATTHINKRTNTQVI